MPRDEMERTLSGAHDMRIVNRESAELSGVTQVVAFDDTQVLLLTGAGEMTLMGEGLHVEHLELEAGRMTISGRVDAVQYRDAPSRRQGFFRRALK